MREELAWVDIFTKRRDSSLATIGDSIHFLAYSSFISTFSLTMSIYPALQEAWVSGKATAWLADYFERY